MLNLLPLLQQIAQNRTEVKLLNIYKGLPISYGANIQAVGEDGILVHSNRYQLACLYYQRETYLQTEELPFIIRSQVMSLNLGKENATLVNLETTKSSIGNRSQFRVEPEEPMVVVIQFRGSSSEILAQLADISAGGACVHFETHLFPARLFQPGNEITMTLALPDSVSQKIKKMPSKPLIESRDTKSFFRTNVPGGQDGKVVITAQGKVVAVHPDFAFNRYRVGIKLFYKDLSRMVILQYLTQRQTEIIRDLRILSDELYHLKK